LGTNLAEWFEWIKRHKVGWWISSIFNFVPKLEDKKQ
jgi:hypothetical protein